MSMSLSESLHFDQFDSIGIKKSLNNRFLDIMIELPRRGPLRSNLQDCFSSGRFDRIPEVSLDGAYH